jgi:hypothetical protein
MTDQPDTRHIRVTSGLIAGALGGLFLWSVALGYASHLIWEALQWL